MYVRTFTLLALAIPAWVVHPPIGNWRAGDERGVTASWASIGRETYEQTMKKAGKRLGGAIRNGPGRRWACRTT